MYAGYRYATFTDVTSGAGSAVTWYSGVWSSPASNWYWKSRWHERSRVFHWPNRISGGARSRVCQYEPSSLHRKTTLSAATPRTTAVMSTSCPATISSSPGRTSSNTVRGRRDVGHSTRSNERCIVLGNRRVARQTTTMTPARA